MRTGSLILLTATTLTVAGCLEKSDFNPRRESADAPGEARTADDGEFWWGISTSSYQTEDQGPPAENEGFKTDWDLAYEAGWLKHPRGEATWSYTKYERDIAAMKMLGVTHYRFSIEWARVEPRPGEFNQAAIDHYLTMIRAMRAAGITPIVALWHFTFPSWLAADSSKTHGWLHPQFAQRWEEYVERMAAALAPEVEYFAPESEPNTYALGIMINALPPGGTFDYQQYLHTLNVEADAFRTAVKIIRGARPDAKIVAIENMIYWRKNLLDVFGFWKTKGAEFNFYHLDRIIDDCDYIGINYYFSELASPAARMSQSLRSGAHVSDLGWTIDAEGLEKMIHIVSRRYGKPMLITENGIADADNTKRPRYLLKHVYAIRRAIRDGCDVRGYFYWSLIDNFEWAEGYGPKFGLFSMNADTHDLIAKPSCEIYRAFARENPRPLSDE